MIAESQGSAGVVLVESPRAQVAAELRIAGLPHPAGPPRDEHVRAREEPGPPREGIDASLLRVSSEESQVRCGPPGDRPSVDPAPDPFGD